MDPEQTSHRKLAAILMADAVGYSRLMGADEAATVAAIKASREIFREQVQRRAGRIVNAPGDSILAEFGSVVDALAAAVEIQRELAERNARLPEAESMPFRIGINLGDVVSEDDAVYGDGVNIAARLEALAEPGGICISRAAHEQVKGKLPLEFEYLGEHAVKNIAEPVRVYRVLSVPGAAAHRAIAAQARGFRAGKWMGLSAAAVVLVALATAGVFYEFGTGEAPIGDAADSLPLPEKPSIAVLPFENLSGDPEQEYLADGITDTLITDLSKIQNLLVIARNSTVRYQGQTVNVRQVGRELGVRHVLEGSVQRAGDRLRINVQLSDTMGGAHVWAERYDRPGSDIFLVQDDIVQQVVTEMAVQLTEGERAGSWLRTTSNPKAYELFLQGKARYNLVTRDDNLRAREFFNRALELDEGFALARAWLAWTYVQDVYNGWRGDPDEWLSIAVGHAEAANAMAPEVPEVLAILGEVYINVSEHEKSLAAYERAYRLGITNADMMNLAAWNFAFQGRPVLALEMAQKSLQMSPYPSPWYWGGLGNAYLAAGRPAEAIESLRRCVDGLPDWWWCRAGLLVALVENGELEGAVEQAEQILRLQPRLTSDHNLFVEQTTLNAGLSARVSAAFRAAGLP